MGTENRARPGWGWHGLRGLLGMALLAAVAACGGGAGGSAAGSAVAEDSSAAAGSLRAVGADGSVSSFTLRNDLSLSSSCYLQMSDFASVRGRILPGQTACGEFVAQTDGGGAPYSIGRFEYNQDLSDDITLQASVQKLTGNPARPTELYFLGGAFGWAFANGQASYYLYESESHWTGWVPSALFDASGPNQVTVHQTGSSVRVLVNGSFLDSFELAQAPSASRVSVFFKGDPGVREEMRFTDFVVLDRGRSHALVAESDGSDLSRLHLQDPSAVPAGGEVLDLGAVSGSRGSALKRVVLFNGGSAALARPRLVLPADSAVQEVAMAHPDSCLQLSQLGAGQRCAMFIGVSGSAAAAVTTAQTTGPMSDGAGLAKAASVVETRAALTFGSAYRPLATRFQPAPAGTSPRLSHLEPAQWRVGRRTAITVVGSQLPASLTLSVPGVRCENQGRTVANRVYCTADSALGTKASVYDSSRGSLLGTLPVSISPALYGDPIEATYLKSVQRGFGQYVKGLGYHTGWDIMTADANPAVRAIADGKVVYNTIDASKYKTPYDRYWSAFIVVQHAGFCAYYAHLDNSGGIKPGAQVRRGDILGKVRDAYDGEGNRWTANNHLHLSFSTQGKCQSSGWGYKSGQSDVTGVYADPSGYVALQ